MNKNMRTLKFVFQRKNTLSLCYSLSYPQNFANDIFRVEGQVFLGGKMLSVCFCHNTPSHTEKVFVPQNTIFVVTMN